MADKDDELVTIHLDEPRQYRDRESWQVTTIGPGRVKVPASTAKKWKITPEGGSGHGAKAAAPADEAKPAAAG